MSQSSALHFLKSFKEHEISSQQTLKSLNDTYLHEKVYVTLSCPEIYKRTKTAGVITAIERTLGKYFRFTIITEQGRELIVRLELASEKAFVQGNIMDVKIEVI